MAPPSARPFPLHRASAWLRPSTILPLCALALFILCPTSAFAQSGRGEPLQVAVAGTSNAFYFKPRVKRANRVVVIMHGHGGNPHDDCLKWSRVATEFGWLLCPAGPEDMGNGSRGWNNDWPGAQRVVDSALEALRRLHPSVQRHGNVLVGFSEGAYAAMNIGVREPSVFDRWLILASAARYWGGPGLEALDQNRRSIKRVYLLTGALDAPVLEESREAYEILKKHKVHTRLRVVHGMGHEVPPARMRELYHQPLSWLVNNR